VAERPKNLHSEERSKCLTMKSAPVGIRTSNLLIRSQMLYPVELRAPGKRLICGGEGKRQIAKRRPPEGFRSHIMLTFVIRQKVLNFPTD
jgi:hypothetical protein